MPKRNFERPPQTSLKELAEELGVGARRLDMPMQPQAPRADSAPKSGREVLEGLGLVSSRNLALGRLALSVTPDIPSLLGLEGASPFLHPNPHARVALTREKDSRFWPEDFAWRAYRYTQHHAPNTSRGELEGTGHLKLYSAASTPDFYSVRLNVDAETPAGQNMIEESQRLYPQFSRKPESLQPRALKPNATLYLLDKEYAQEHRRDLEAKIDYKKVAFTLGAVSLGYTYVRPESTP